MQCIHGNVEKPNDERDQKHLTQNFSNGILIVYVMCGLWHVQYFGMFDMSCMCGMMGMLGMFDKCGSLVCLGTT